MNLLRPFLCVLCVLFSVNGQTQTIDSPAVSSSSLQWSQDRHTIYSANLWHGSISQRAAAPEHSQLPPQQLSLGKDIRRIAINHQQQELMATDYLNNETIWVDLKSWSIKQRIPTGQRPFGVVYQASHDRYWVSIFEDHQLLAIQDGEIIHSISTLDTPRGLALLDDRLFVTHSMTGQLSIYDVSSLPEKPTTVISLAEIQHTDETVSQGLPRLLDDIAISPDGKEAWLPHVLWNFDHKFQFQSTVFPAVSVIELTPGHEKERIDHRKELFKTINIVSKNRTRIVSNPADAEFSASGKKVYISLSGSDDIIVFDRSRSGKSNKKRHRRKKHSGGAKASQIYRHTPEQNPRGLLVHGNTLWVQQAISHTLTTFDRGGDNAFDRLRLHDTTQHLLTPTNALSAPHIDSIDRGRALFHSANTDLNPAHPIAGDFWMSCNSCHLDGFNFTNQYLLEAYGQDKKKDARVGHTDLDNMISGDFITDYLNIIQKTQGGMGEDDRDGAVLISPQQAPDEIMDDMMDLHHFVTLPHNLPFVATWLRTDEKTPIHPREFTNSAQCAECHQPIFDQWADSNHRLMGESNPYFMTILEIAGKEEGENFKDWCLGCHMPNNVLSNTPISSDGHMFEKNGATLKTALANKQPDLDEGTGCLFCHRIMSLEDAGGNAAFTVNLSNRDHYVGEKETDSTLLQWFASRQINSKPDAHKASYIKPFYDDPTLCKSCHNEFAPGTGAMIVDTFGEWESSSYNNPSDPAQHKTCIDCHMHGDIAQIGNNIPGLSTQRGTAKQNVVTHQFTGANHHLVGLRNKQQEAMSIQLLRSAATLEQHVAAQQDDSPALIVSVKNVGAGHSLPTGVADFRQFWLEVIMRDVDGNIIFSSGVADGEGNLPSDTRLFMKVMGDATGQPVGLRFWRYSQLLSDTRIPANGSREERFSIPHSAKPITVNTRLLYRIYPQWVTRQVQVNQPDLPTPPIVELSSITNVLSLPATLK